MFTNINEDSRRIFSAFAAVAIVGFSGLVLDQGHIAAAPRGVVELGELTPVGAMQAATVTLPEVVVTASRLIPADGVAELPMLAEVQVIGQREVLIARAPAQRHSFQV